MRYDSKNYFPSIDGIRAIAVMLVLFFHLELELFSGGYVGVDIFFVISGYLITRNIVLAIRAGNFSLVRFYKARIRRLIPALLVTILASLIVGFLLFSPDALIRLGGSAIAGVLSLANIRFWMSAGYFDSDAISKPLLHLWSLSVEEQFYLFWPILMVASCGYFKRSKNTLLVFWLVMASSFIAANYYLESHPDVVFYWMPFRAYEFAIGGLYAYFEVTRSSNSVHSLTPSVLVNNLFMVVGSCLVVASASLFAGNTPFPGYYSLVPCIGAFCLLVAKDASLSGLILANPLMRKIGQISYSLYLVHWPIWVFISYFAVSALSPFEKLLTFILMLGLGWLLNVSVEKRFRYSSSKRLEGIADLTFYIVLSVTMMAIIVIGFLIRSNSGFPQRVTNQAPVDRLGDYAKCDHPRGDKSVRICNFGETVIPKKRMLVVGDSHSMNLASGLNAFAVKHKIDVTVYSVAGCAPLLNVEIFMKGVSQPMKTCKEFSQNLNQLLIENGFDVVMISARWTWHFEHDKYYLGQNPPQWFLSDKHTQELSTEASREVWLRSLSDTINLVRSAGKRVVLLSQYPLLHNGIGECDKSPSLLIDRNRVSLRCRTQIPYKTIMQRLDFADRSVASFEDFDVLPILPSDHLCDHKSKSCDVLTDKGLLYADDNHLSAQGGHFLIMSVEAKLSDFLFK